MSKFLPNHYSTYDVLKHKELPLYLTAEFDFYRCVKFDNTFYGKTVSQLHQGNLRERKDGNRYSMLFSNKKVSYWADSKATARAEMSRHKQGHNLLTFFAYDDATSTFPILSRQRDCLRIIDGRQFDFHEILLKDDNGIPLSNYDKELIARIEAENPDCLAYKSVAKKGGVNFLFFENGFKKLVIREVTLRLGDEVGKNNNCIGCAGTCDYISFIEHYGDYFLPKARIGHDESYELTEEYLKRKEVQNYWRMARQHEIKSQPHIKVDVNQQTGEIKIYDKT